MKRLAKNQNIYSTSKRHQDWYPEHITIAYKNINRKFTEKEIRKNKYKYVYLHNNQGYITLKDSHTYHTKVRKIQSTGEDVVK